MKYDSTHEVYITIAVLNTVYGNDVSKIHIPNVKVLIHTVELECI